MTRTIFFIRHGQTDWNAEGRLQGARDIPLNDRGREQARRNGGALGPLLAEHGYAPQDLLWWCSPLQRCRETMGIVRTAMGLDPADYALERQVQEISFGAWEGSTLAELKTRTPDLVRARKQDRWGFRPPEGESYEDLSNRIAGWLSGVTRDCVVVSHGGVNRALRGLIEGLPSGEIPVLEVPQDRILLIRGDRTCWK